VLVVLEEGRRGNMLTVTKQKARVKGSQIADAVFTAGLPPGVILASPIEGSDAWRFHVAGCSCARRLTGHGTEESAQACSRLVVLAPGCVS
jgi:hypothetical protein